jgi:ubiquinol-cytochrome c reductase cytochrome c subunit
MRFHLLLPPAAAAVTALLGVTAGTTSDPAVAGAAVVEQPVGREDSRGATLYATHCAACHGDRGLGVASRGPALTEEGEAAADFALRTGRMPMAAPNLQARRSPVRFSEDEIVALVEFVGEMGDGPDIPDVDARSGDVAAGGQLYRLNCAACHVTSGAGAAIGGGREAPSLMSSSPTEIGEALLVGPGAMPTFQTFTTGNIDDVAAYIVDLQSRNTTGVDDLGGAGPVAEGLAAWLLGLIPLIAITRWIGTPHEGRDARAVAAPDVDEAQQ